MYYCFLTIAVCLLLATNVFSKLTGSPGAKTGSPMDGNNCTACHGTVSPQAGLSLVTYSQVRNAAENGNLIARMNDPIDPMPESGRLDASIRALIDQWAEDGFLEN